MSSPLTQYWLIALPPDAPIEARTPSPTDGDGHRRGSEYLSAETEAKKHGIYTGVRSRVMRSDPGRAAHAAQGAYGDVFKFIIPDFKIGTLDQLVLLSDDLGKMDHQFEAIVIKIVQNIRVLLDSNEAEVASQLIVYEKTPDAFLRGFQWNTMKYRSDRPIREISETLAQEMGQIDNVMKTKMSAFNQTKTQFTSKERKQGGSLMVKNLVEVVNKDDLVLDSEYLETLLVVVPKFMQSNWLNEYETISTMVVPRSTHVVTQDAEFVLNTVTVFSRAADDFKNNAREKKYQVRDFSYDEAEIAKDKTEMIELGSNMKTQWSNLLRLLKTNFGEAFSAWIHLKALRVFVESVLRYGLPPVFQAMMIKPNAKSHKKVRDILTSCAEQSSLSGGAMLMSSTTGGAGGGDVDDLEQDAVAGILGESDYYPYVYFPIVWGNARG